MVDPEEKWVPDVICRHGDEFPFETEENIGKWKGQLITQIFPNEKVPRGGCISCCMYE